MIDLYDWLMWIVIWIMGAVYGWYARERYAKRLVDRFVNQFVEQQAEQISEQFIPIIIEKHNGVFYVYDKEKNDFMAQGSTRRELEDALAKRYPNKRFMAEKENLKVFNESI